MGVPESRIAEDERHKAKQASAPGLSCQCPCPGIGLACTGVSALSSHLFYRSTAYKRVPLSCHFWRWGSSPSYAVTNTASSVFCRSAANACQARSQSLLSLISP